MDNLGQPAIIPAGNTAQSPSFAMMSANYIMFASTAKTLLGQGEIIFEGPKTTSGGDEAIDIQNSTYAGNNETY